MERYFSAFVCMVALVAGSRVAWAEGLRQRLEDGTTYYAIRLERRNRLPAKDFIDALVFTPLGPSYRSIRRLDGDHLIVLRSLRPNKEAAALDEAALSEYEDLITRDRLVPAAIRGKNGRELALVYCVHRPCFISKTERANGEVVLSLRESLLDEREEFDRTRRIMGIPLP